MEHLLNDELHVHLYGCLSASDLFELGRDRHCQDMVADRLDWYAAEYAKAWGRTPDWRQYWSKASGFDQLRADFEFVDEASFAHFQACFNLAIALFPVRPDQAPVLAHVMRRHRNQGLRYVEYRLPVPVTMAASDIPEYVTTHAHAAVACEKESGGHYVPRLAFSCSRDPQLMKVQYAAIKAAQRDPNVARAVVAIDFCGVEEGNPPKQLREAVAGVLRDNANDPRTALAVLYHVGESWGDKGLASTVRWVHEAHALGTHRLGHALALGIANERNHPESTSEQHEHGAWLKTNAGWLKERGYEVGRSGVRQLQDAVMDDLAAKGAVVESCITSNVRIGRLGGPRRHPLRRFVDRGLNVVLSTDDPGVFATDLASEERLARDALGLTQADVAKLAKSAVAARSSRLSGRPE